MQRFSPQKSSPIRLDMAIVAYLGISRSQAQKYITQGCVSVNNTPCMSNHEPVTSREIITVNEEAFIEQHPPRVHEAIPLSIIFEDADVIVLNKPAGVLVHPTKSADPEYTLMHAVLAYFPPMEGVGGDELRSGVVHRLDREASGVVIFAKHTEAHTWLKTQFKTRQTQKWYDVLVLGNVRDDAGTITFPIARSSTHGRMAARPQSQDGKEAITHYDVVQRYSTSTLLRVRIETGRTHQIRAHFFALGHPVAGDTVYTQRKLKQLPLPRLFLHAQELGITLPSGEAAHFTAPLPMALADCLTTLKPL